MARWLRLLRSKAALIRRAAALRHRLKLSREECDWLREQNEGYRDAFHSLQTQHLAVGAQAKGYIKAMEQEKSGHGDGPIS